MRQSLTQNRYLLVGAGLVVGFMFRSLIALGPWDKHTPTEVTTPPDHSPTSQVNRSPLSDERASRWRSQATFNLESEQHAPSDSQVDEGENPAAYAELQKVRAESLKSVLEDRSSANESQYSALLAGLTISESDRTTVLRRVKEVQKLALELGVALQNFKEAQLEYDLRLRRFLSEDDYQTYIGRENARRASNEFQAIVAFSAKQGATIPPNATSAVISAIQETSAYTLPKEITPYLDFPDIRVETPRGAVTSMQRLAASHQNTAKLLIERLSDKGVDPSTQELVALYYSSTIRKLEASAANLERNLNSEASPGQP